MLELIQELINTPGISGYETPIREKITEIIKPYAKPSVDGIGNLHVTIGDGKQHIIFVAHMDELGFVVSKINDDGLIKIKMVTGDDRVLSGRVYNILTKKGLVPSVIGIKPVHLIFDHEEMKRVVPSDRVYLDVGARSKKEVKDMGIEPFDPVVLKKDITIINKRYLCARGIDNRVSCAVLIEALQKLSKKKLGCKVSFIWSVQEEIGLRGAAVVSNTVKPDIAFAIDTFSTSDCCPDAPANFPAALLGKGPVLRMIDNRAMASQHLRDTLLDIARKNKIPLQLGIGGGSTDGAVLQECGAPMMPIGVPVRYTHSPTELVHLDDIDNLLKLVIKIVEHYS